MSIDRNLWKKKASSSRRANPSDPLHARLTDPTYTEATDVEAPALTAAHLVPEHLLDGGELVILAIKPSLWFIVFTSARWLISMLCVIVATGWLGRSVPQLVPVEAALVVRAALMLGAARVVFATLQWASCLFVLTNRRIMRLSGVMNVDVFECPLTKIQQTYLSLVWYERLTRLGTLSFATAGTGGVESTWLHVNDPLEVHERVRSAIHRAQQHGQGV